jgi:hypothetical protein
MTISLKFLDRIISFGIPMGQHFISLLIISHRRNPSNPIDFSHRLR